MNKSDAKKYKLESATNEIELKTTIDIVSELSKRERFAMAAMQGLCANPRDAEETVDDIAVFATMYADALLKQLEETE